MLGNDMRTLGLLRGAIIMQASILSNGCSSLHTPPFFDLYDSRFSCESAGVMRDEVEATSTSTSWLPVNTAAATGAKSFLLLLNRSGSADRAASMGNTTQPFPKYGSAGSCCCFGFCGANGTKGTGFCLDTAAVLLLLGSLLVGTTAGVVVVLAGGAADDFAWPLVDTSMHSQSAGFALV
jgi:hypothetical protein